MTESRGSAATPEDVASISDDELSDIVENLRWAQEHVHSRRDLPGSGGWRREWAARGAHDLQTTVERIRHLRAEACTLRQRLQEAEARRSRLAELEALPAPDTSTLNGAGPRPLAQVARALSALYREIAAHRTALETTRDEHADMVGPLEQRREEPPTPHQRSRLSALGPIGSSSRRPAAPPS